MTRTSLFSILFFLFTTKAYADTCVIPNPCATRVVTCYQNGIAQNYVGYDTCISYYSNGVQQQRPSCTGLPCGTSVANCYGTDGIQRQYPGFDTCTSYYGSDGIQHQQPTCSQAVTCVH